MKTYHVAELGQPIGGHDAADGDELVPIDELDDPNGRWSNCGQCIEALAQRRGGSTHRPQPPVHVLDDGDSE
jgi:hypothetical protein